MRCTAAVLFALLALAAAAAAQSIRGIVLDDAAGDPLPGTLVVLLDPAGARLAATEAGVDGHFRIALEGPGEYVVATERLGHHRAASGILAVRGGDILELEFRLASDAIRLEPIEVRVEARRRHLERAGFSRRRAMGIGRFLTAADIEERTPLRTTDALRTEPSVRILLSPDAMGEYVAFRGAHTMLFSKGHRPCMPLVVLDGDRLGNSGDVNLVDPENIEAIELYPSGNGAPIQYGGSLCGVILIWTKR